MEGAKRSAVRDYLDRVFIERELFLRANDKVQYLRLSRSLQQGLVAAGAVGFCWLLYATGSLFWQSSILSGKDDELSKQQLAYFNLLAEVSEYHDQFEQITQDLQQNQSFLLSMIESGVDSEAELKEVQRGLARSETEHARIVLAREGLREKLESYEAEISEIGDRNLDLRSQVADMREFLNTSPDEHKQVLTARERLGGQLRETELALAQAAEDRDRFEAEALGLTKDLIKVNSDRTKVESEAVTLKATIEELSTEVKTARDDRISLNHTIAKLEEALDREIGYGDGLEKERAAYEAQVVDLKGELETAVENKRELATKIVALEASLETAVALGKSLDAEKALLSTRVAALDGDLSGAQQETVLLENTIAELEQSLGGQAERSTKLQHERDFYEVRVGSLEVRLDAMRDAQHSVVERLIDRTTQSMGQMERTVAMTGMDVDSVLNGVTVSNLGLNQGGPFVPGDFISETDPTYELQASVAILDLHLDRWEALQRVVKMLPLTAPLDHYRVSSGYGARTDPMNGRKAAHYGLDMAAPMKSKISATAPGKVIFAGWRGRYGRMIEIDHGLGIRTRYGHLRKILVKPGQEVGHREKIGLLGSSGRSTGPHVHYEVLVNGKPVDPGNFLEAGRHVFQG